MVNDEVEEPRKLVVGFVKSHKGCMKEDIVEGLSKIGCSRVPLLETVKQLLEDKILINKSNNRRDYKLYLNTDNLLASVPEELEEFEKAYLTC